MMASQRLYHLLLLILFLSCPIQCKTDSKSFPGLTKKDDFITHLMGHIAFDLPIIHHVKEKTLDGKGRKVFYHLVRLDNPKGHLYILTANDKGCPGREKTSTTSKLVGCKVAVNAGFFNMQTGDCIGNVISRGHLAQISGLNNVNFGWTDDQFYIGYLTKDTIKSIEWDNLVSGVIWLLRKGEAYWEESNAIETPDFINIRAQRTVIGHDQMGRAYLLVVEGVEVEGLDVKDENLNDSSKDDDKGAGLTIAELTDLVKRIGMYNAINLDGGGSSNMAIDGKLVHEISEYCMDDQSKLCERPVTTIVCIK